MTVSKAKSPRNQPEGLTDRVRIAPRYSQQEFSNHVPWNDGNSPVVVAIEAVITAPDGVNLVIVKIVTSDDGLHGVGCATFTQRAFAVKEVIDSYLAPQVIGRSVHDISDIWQTNNLSSYWRGGPVLHSAISGIDQALWDIKGKLANLPVWQLLGGRVRNAAESYIHASGRDVAELRDQIDASIEAGYKHIRCQVTVPGTSTYGAALQSSSDSSWDAEKYIRMIPEVFEVLSGEYGDRVKFLHDVHERLHPHETVHLVKALEPYSLFFIEDPLAPEDIGWLPQLRQSTNAPLAYGELVTSFSDFMHVVSNRLVDYIRCHISVLGGLTPARQLDSLAQSFGVKTAWHGPRDVSPIGHSVNLALGITSSSFGIHEHFEFSDLTREIFPGTITSVDGSVNLGNESGLGVGFDQAAAKKCPAVSAKTNWHYSRVRRKDGALQRP